MAYRNRKPVVVFAGEFWLGATGSGFANGFRQLGWIVHEIDLRYFIGQAKTTIRDKIVGRLQRQPALEAYRTRILSDCRALKPDLFLTTKGIGITPDLLSKIKALDVVTANFYTDYHFNYPDVDQAAFPLYDRFITCKSFQIEWLEQRREPGTTHFIPNGYSQQTHLPVYRSIGPDDYLNDVGYAGNRSSYKQALLKDLLALNPDLDLKITGSNWQEFADTSARPDIYDGVPRVGPTYCEFIQRSRINLSFHFGQTSSEWQDLISRRTWEIPACNGFMLHVDNEEVRQYFTVGSEIDTFSTPDEMNDKIRYYLANPDVREKMKARAFERAVPAYSCAARAAEVAALFDFD